jgi:ribosomal protein S18 acetylase RimI-like enzyme
MIRELRSEDRDSIIELVRATKHFSEPEVAIARELIDICVEQPDQQDYHAYVAEASAATSAHSGAQSGRNEANVTENRIAGFLLLGPTPATEGTYDMYWIAVHPDFQGRGIAQELDEYATEFVRKRNGYWLIAETSGQPGYERTRGFYTKQGYQSIARIPDYYKPGDDLIVFGKRLDQR